MRKIFSALLIVSLIIFHPHYQVHCSEGKFLIGLTPDKQSYKAGQTAEITVSFEADEASLKSLAPDGLGAIQLILSYPMYWSVVKDDKGVIGTIPSVENGGIADKKRISDEMTDIMELNNENGWTDNTKKLIIQIFGDSEGAYVPLKNSGIVAKLEMKIPENADSGQYKLQISDKAGETSWSTIIKYKDKVTGELKNVNEKGGIVQSLSSEWADINTGDINVESSSSGGGGGGGLYVSKPDSTPKPSAKSVDFPVATSASMVENLIFTDVPENFWGNMYIHKLADRGVINGKGGGLFGPDDNVTREQFVKMLVKAFDISDSANGPDFSDVSKDAWCYPFISIAYNKGIIKGISETEFGTGSNITRQDMTVMTARTLSSLNIKLSDIKPLQGFSDDSNISEYARDSVYAMQKADIINGLSDGLFAPYQSATRAQAAKIICMLIK